MLWILLNMYNDWKFISINWSKETNINGVASRGDIIIQDHFFPSWSSLWMKIPINSVVENTFLYPTQKGRGYFSNNSIRTQSKNTYST